MLKHILIISLCFFAILFLAPTALSQDETIAQVKKSLIFLGEVSASGGYQFTGTGFMVELDSVFYLVTAKHVVFVHSNGIITNRELGGNLAAFVPQKNGHIRSVRFEDIKRKLDVNWLYLPYDSSRDMAIIPFAISEDDDIKTFPQEWLIKKPFAKETMDLYYWSFQPEINPPSEMLPVCRKGMVARVNKDGSVYMDGFVFPGNSGSPVLVLSKDISRSGGRISFGPDSTSDHPIGLVSSSVTYQDIAISTQTGQPRVSFQENTGLTYVVPISTIWEIRDTKIFELQNRRLRNLR